MILLGWVWGRGKFCFCTLKRVNVLTNKYFFNWHNVKFLLTFSLLLLFKLSFIAKKTFLLSKSFARKYTGLYNDF